MKWFKHMTDASRDEKLAALTSLHGPIAYARYWRILETIAEQMDESDRCSLTLPWSRWAQITWSRGRKQARCNLEAIAMQRLCILDATDLQATCSVPNLLKIRARKKPIGSKTRTLDTDTDTEVDKEKKKEEKRKAQPKVSPESYFSSLNGKVDQWVKTYPLVDVPQEIEKMKAWLIANPNRQKKNYDRFVVNWLASARPRTKTWQEKFDEEMRNDPGRI